MNPFRTFRCLTVISVVHMDAYMLTLRLQLLEVFRLHVMPRHVSETKPRKRKPVKHQFFQTSRFLFVLEQVVWFSFWVSKVNLKKGLFVSSNP